MNRLASLIVLIFTCVVFTASQTKSELHPDFSGSWLLNTVASKIPESTGVLFEIDHSEPVLKIARKSRQLNKDAVTESTFFTDARGEVNQWPGDGKTESITKWDGKKLIRTYINESTQNQTREEWSISSNRNRLFLKFIISVKSSVPSISQKMELIYDKVKTHE